MSTTTSLDVAATATITTHSGIIRLFTVLLLLTTGMLLTRHYYYCVMCGICIGMDYDYRYVIDVVAGSKACKAEYSAIQTYITAAVWAFYRQREWGETGERRWGAGNEEKRKGKEEKERKCKEAKVKAKRVCRW